MNSSRWVLHVDLNSFFASCEQQDEPNLRGRPLGVVQDSGKRGVIIGSSREAKLLDIGTGMLVWQAKKIFPEIEIRPARFDRYVNYAKRLRQICRHYSDRVEIFSIDELFLDVSQTQHLFGGPLAIAGEIKRRLKVELGSLFTVSVGLAENKMLAKMASDSQKPDGLVTVQPQEALEFLDRFKLTDVCGIAQGIEARLQRLGIFNFKQLRQTPKTVLKREFGAMGNVYWHWAWGQDFSPVLRQEEVPGEKSLGSQVTLPDPISKRQEILAVFLWLAWQVAARMRAKSLGARTAALSLGQAVKRLTPTQPHEDAYDLFNTVKTLYTRMNRVGAVRFVGISAENLLPLGQIPPTLLANPKKERLALSWDKIANRWGPFCLRPASLLGKTIKGPTVNGFTKRF